MGSKKPKTLSAKQTDGSKALLTWEKVPEMYLQSLEDVAAIKNEFKSQINETYWHFFGKIKPARELCNELPKDIPYQLHNVLCSVIFKLRNKIQLFANVNNITKSSSRKCTKESTEMKINDQLRSREDIVPNDTDNSAKIADDGMIVLSTMDGFGVGGVIDGSEFTICNSYIKMFHRNISQSSTLGTAIGILAAGDKSEDSKTMVKKIDHMSVLKKYHLSLNCIAYVFSKFFQSYCMLNICEKGITGTIAGVPVTLNITSGFGGDQVAMDANVRNTFGEAANISQSQIGLYDNFNNEIQLFFGKINWSIVHKYGVMLPI